MKLLIGIATYKRIEKLERCLQSIHDSSYQNFQVQIVADNKDIETIKHLNKKLWFNHKEYSGCIQERHEFVIGAWNRVIQENIEGDWDGFIGLCDDIELHPDALENIVKFHQFYFRDTDGVVGFKQECPGFPNYTFKWFGQTLMGRRFVERYKEGGYQICCPDYYHFFQDEEMFEYASTLLKFMPCDKAVLKHYHPSFVKEEMDETHNIIRKGLNSPINHDNIMRKTRKHKKFLWGHDFNLIGTTDAR